MTKEERRMREERQFSMFNAELAAWHYLAQRSAAIAVYVHSEQVVTLGGIEYEASVAMLNTTHTRQELV